MSSPLDLGVFDEKRLDEHGSEALHPERPERLTAARRALEGREFERVAGRDASQEELRRVHTEDYLARLELIRNQRGYLDSDTYFVERSVELARLAAGGCLALTERSMSTNSVGVALARPPGHHARPNAAMGFCLLNNAAIAAAHARALGAERVFIFDWDVHHGNGTEEAFFSDPNVLYSSLHQSPFYPGTGHVGDVGQFKGTGFNINVPLLGGCGDGEYLSALERVILPIATAFAPDFLIISAGFDASARDPLGQMILSDDAFGWMAASLVTATLSSTKGRALMVLEGGYDLIGLELGLRSAIDGLTLSRHGFKMPVSRSDAAIDRCVRKLRPYWPELR